MFWHLHCRALTGVSCLHRILLTEEQKIKEHIHTHTHSNRDANTHCEGIEVVGQTYNGSLRIRQNPFHPGRLGSGDWHQTVETFWHSYHLFLIGQVRRR